MELKDIAQMSKEEQAKALMDRFKEMINESKSESLQKIEDISQELKDFKARTGRFSPSSSTETGGLQRMITEWVSSEYKNLKGLTAGTGYRYEVKAAGTMLTSSNLSGSVYQSGVNRIPARSMYPFHLRDIISIVPTSTGSVNYPREASPLGEGSFQKTTEGNTKNLVDYDVNMIGLSLKYIAGRAKVSREMLQDLPFLQQYLGISLTEDFLETEDGYYYNDIAALATTGTTSETLVAAKVLDYIVQVENAGHRPTDIITTPSGWKSILATKPNDYSVPGGVKITDNGEIMVAGLRLHKSPGVPSGKVYVGDFSKVVIAQSDGLNIRSTEYNSDDFEKNLVSFRCEARCDLMNFAPSAFVYGDL